MAFHAALKKMMIYLVLVTTIGLHDMMKNRTHVQFNDLKLLDRKVWHRESRESLSLSQEPARKQLQKTRENKLLI